MLSPQDLHHLPAIEPADLVITGVDLEQHLGPWAAACPFEADHAGTATMTVSLVEQEPGELLEQMRAFFKRDPRTGTRRLEKWNVLRLHETNYILREMGRTETGFDLVFYDEASEDLKRYSGPLKWTRDRFTRAEGVKGLANEAGVQSYIPDRGVRQPIADLPKKDRKAVETGRLSRFDQVYPQHFLDQATGKVRFTATQVRAIAESVGLPGLAFTEIAKGESQYYPGVVQRDPGDGNVGYGLWQITPHAWGGSGKLLGKLADLGGIPAMRNPLKCAAMAKFMFDDSGLQPWTTSKFLSSQARTEAAGTPRSDNEGGEDGVVDRAHVERFEFAVAAREDYWDAIERLAQQVRWRRFAVFNHLAYASDTTFTEADPFAISLDDDWLDAPALWTVTTGRRIDNLPLHGRLAAVLPPGMHVAIKDDDPCYGSWLVRNFKRDMLDPECEVDITLGRPAAPLPEPASTVKTVSVRDKSTPRGGARVAIQWAQSKIGHYRESLGSNRGPELDELEAKFGFKAAPWCAIFATSAAAQGAGADVKTAAVRDIQTWGAAGSHGYRKGLWNATPRPGDLLCIPAGGDDHVAFIEQVHATHFTCIEGNTSAGQVVRTEYRGRGDGDVRRPDYGR